MSTAVYLHDPLVEKMLAVLVGNPQNEVIRAVNRLQRIVACYCGDCNESKFQVEITSS